MNTEKNVSSHAPVRCLTTTLNEIRRDVLYDDDWKQHREALGIIKPHHDPWKNLLKRLGKTKSDDEPFPFELILEVNGFDYALSALTEVRGYNGAQRLYLSNCARKVLPIYEKAYPDDLRPRQAIETAERFARGQATESERHAAEVTAWAAWNDAKIAAEPTGVLNSRWFIGGSTRKTAAWDAAVVAAYATLLFPIRDMALANAECAEGCAAAWRKWVAPLRTMAVELKIPGAVVVGALVAGAIFEGYILGGNNPADKMVPFACAGAWFLAMEAIQALVESSMKAAYKSAKVVAEEDFKREFIRLCRLEGEYGEAPE